jgi:hypothetical protein
MVAYPFFAIVDRFNSARGQKCGNFIDYDLPIANETRGKTTPDRPTGTLKDTLPHHVIWPFVGPMVAIPVAFDGNALVVVTLDHKIDSEVSDTDLSVDPEAAFAKQVEHFSLEVGFASIAPILQVGSFGWVGASKMLQKGATQLIARAQLIQLNRANKVGSISSPRQGDVEALLISIA